MTIYSIPFHVQCELSVLWWVTFYVTIHSIPTYDQFYDENHSTWTFIPFHPAVMNTNSQKERCWYKLKKKMLQNKTDIHSFVLEHWNHTSDKNLHTRYFMCRQLIFWHSYMFKFKTQLIYIWLKKNTSTMILVVI